MRRQYVLTERAHFMCPNMHFGMVVEVEKSFNLTQLQETLDRMAQAHPFLRSLIAQEEGSNQIYYKIMPVSQIVLSIRENENILWEDYQKIANQDWNVFQTGLLKVFVYPKTDGMKVLFVIHHLLADGRGGLEIAEEFANDYVANVHPIYVEEQLLEAMSDLPPKSRLSGISKFLIKQANARWNKENHTVSYEQYSNFIRSYAKEHPVEHETYVVNSDTVLQMSKSCRENGVTVNDLLMAKMYQSAKTDKVIIASDIRNSLPKYRKGALGNYATAMGIVCRAKTTDEMKLAKEVHRLVKKHMTKNQSRMLVLACYFEMEPTLLDAAAISALGGFDSKAGRFVGAGMFHMDRPKSYSITNLGKVNNQNMKSVMFIPPASPAAKLTLGIVTLNGTMRACSSKNQSFSCN